MIALKPISIWATPAVQRSLAHVDDESHPQRTVPMAPGEKGLKILSPYDPLRDAAPSGANDVALG
jgi:hypothetical protein